MAQQIVIKVPGTKISELEMASSVSRKDTTPVVQNEETKQASVGSIADLVKSELGSAAFKSSSEFATPSSVNSVDIASKMRADAVNERVDVVEYAVSSMQGGGDASFKTYEEMLAYTPPKPNVTVRVNNDPDVTKNGTYTWDGVAYVKSPYDPYIQTKEYVDEKIELKKSIKKLFSLKDVINIPVLSVYTDGSVWIKGLKLDVAAFINSLNTKVDFLNSLIKVGAGKNYFVFNDVNNLPLIKLNQNKDLFIPKIGNLTEQALLSKKITSKLAQSLSSAAGAEYADNVLEQLTNSQSSTTLTAITAAQVNDSGIFPHPVTMLRIPAITRIAVNKYLCFFEARRDGDDFGENSQGVVTLTVDQDNLTVSATNLQSLHSTYVDENNKRWSFMNACAVKLDSGRIIVLYVKRNGTTSHALYKRYSDDDGVTWSEYEDIGHFLNMPFYNLLCPCSQGLVKRFGSNRGRIIFPVWYSGVRYRTEEFRAGYIYSDDDGETWHDGSFNNETMSNEVQCAEDVNGDILFCIRREVTGINTKTWSKLLDGDFKLTPFTPHNQLCETPIMSGLIQAQNKFDKSNAKFHYVGTYSIGRKNLKLFTSFNGGSDWTHEYDVANTNITSVYSCIERLSPTQCFVLWEADYVTSLKCQILSINETNTGKQAQEL
ncbi:glycoside hydrolase [Acinetobacter baumannii]|uniref:exo-alpha-sialidase n=4 Tax=Gammaproteobacteria TaxID=1236 RepID=UPI001F1A4E6E|nr:sialidase family protein [Acinetobacter baumannii]MDC3808482.1 glycoside hydrolase [Acinetobacter baumannii]MDC4004349.1 glycoside hydrolase [Acinetobacter baumannii]MDC4159852.1 glycoside hydrolase [Acinetobacter baumannii]UKD31938.1 glycoside hydrolase [Acinetobacter baumannii]HDX5767410.1 exo-alpha-sialidase [Acinetobacter baumannii]